MIISYQWLLEYLPEAVPVSELSKILTSIGLEVEAVEATDSIPGGLEGLVIGEVLTCAKHPNADKLSITTVSLLGGRRTPAHSMRRTKCSGWTKSGNSPCRRNGTPL